MELEPLPLDASARGGESWRRRLSTDSRSKSSCVMEKCDAERLMRRDRERERDSLRVPSRGGFTLFGQNVGKLYTHFMAGENQQELLSNQR
jgi:hypothetical protein